MKVFVSATVAAGALLSMPAGSQSMLRSDRSTLASEYSRVLTSNEAFKMAPVRSIQARIVGSPPVWDSEHSAFVFPMGATFDVRYRAGMDTLNTANIEGALVYAQAEGIDYSARGSDKSAWCTRKNYMKHVVFYDITIAQPAEAVNKFDSEYGPYSAMDSGQCAPTSVSGTTPVFPQACHYFNGTNGEAKLGAYVGGMEQDTDARAPYPGAWWFSFPNTCPLKRWADKTDACRATTPSGLCPFGTLEPDGIVCTYKYKILGWVPLDDLVGITSMKTSADASTSYKDFREFCQDGGVEFRTDDNGDWLEGISFWMNPKDPAANSERTTRLVQLYAAALAQTEMLSQVTPETLANFEAMPTVSELREENPPCYVNLPSCASATFGCKRDTYSQLCEVCVSDDDTACVKAPSDFQFPPFPVTAPPPTASPTPKPTPTPTPTPATTVRTIQARVVDASPVWDAEHEAFVATPWNNAVDMSLGTFEHRYRAGMDTVNIPSVEAALQYVQVEGVEYRLRGSTDKCTRKENMKYVVFLDVTIAQPKAAVSFFGDEYGAYCAMNNGACTPTGEDGAQPCYYFNGTNGQPKLGAFVGAVDRTTDTRAPYPGAWWFSYPNTCPLKQWATKSEECRASTPVGLCPYGTEPDGVACSYKYKILGWVPIDDLVGITAMTWSNDSSKTYKNFSEFCADGKTELWTDVDGNWIASIDFWRKPKDKAANAERAKQLVDLYNGAVSGAKTLTQVSSDDLARFQAVPSILPLTERNQACHKNVTVCATAQYGCKRDSYSQVCTPCSLASSAGCILGPNVTPAPAPKTMTPKTPTPTTKAPATTAPVASTVQTATSASSSLTTAVGVASFTVSATLGYVIG